MSNTSIALAALFGFFSIIFTICILLIRYADSIERLVARHRRASSGGERDRSVTIHFDGKDALSERLELKAKQRGVSVEQLIHKFVVEAMQDDLSPSGSDALVKTST